MARSVWQLEGPLQRDLGRWLREHSVPRGKIDGQPIRALLNLYNQKIKEEEWVIGRLQAAVPQT